MCRTSANSFQLLKPAIAIGLPFIFARAHVLGAQTVAHQHQQPLIQEYFNTMQHDVRRLEV